MDYQGGRGTRQSRSSGSRPRTIHIDVYCSSSSDGECSSGRSSPSSDDSLSSELTHPCTLVALGSKQKRKTELNLATRRHLEKNRMLERRASSFIFQKTKAYGTSPRNFDKNEPINGSLTKCVLSPNRVDIISDRPASSPPQVCITKDDDCELQNNNLKQSFETKVRSPLSKRGQSPSPNIGNSSILANRSLSHHSSLSYVSSPLEGDNWEPDPDIPSSALSWRGSEFETSTPRLQSELGTGSRSTSAMSPLPNQNINSRNNHNETPKSDPENGTAKSNKHWRSPHLERRKYLQKDQEDRYREAVKRRAEEKPQSPVHTPTEVSDLEKMSIFKNFSREELQVISKSLSKTESIKSANRQDSVRSVGDSLFDIDPTDSITSRSTSPSLVEASVCSHELEKSFKSLVENGSGAEISTSEESTNRSEDPNSRSSQERRDSFISKEWDHENSTVKRRPSITSFTRENLERARLEVASLLSPQSEYRSIMASNEGIYRNGQSQSEELLSPRLKERHFARMQSPASYQHRAVSPTPFPFGGRPINVGLFRNLSRFPFSSQTVPVPASKNYDQRQEFLPNDRRFVRPQVFGEVLRKPRRRGIHFGPPKNPQCSCDSCRWNDLQQMAGAEGSLTGRMRAWSLSDLDPAEADGTKFLPYQSNSYHPLSRNHSSSSDISSFPYHIGKLLIPRSPLPILSTSTNLVYNDKMRHQLNQLNTYTSWLFPS